MILPHLLHRQNYLDFYQTVEGFKILDNGVAEDVVYGAKHLHTLAAEVNPDEIVVPDTLGDANDTLAQAQAFARYARPEYQYMFVLQGQTMHEVLFALQNVDNSAIFAYVTTIGIPRHLASIHKQFRVTLAELMIEENFHERYEIHFLGGTSWPREVVLLGELASGHANVRGVDTSFPAYMGLRGLDINSEDYISRPSDFFDLTYDHIQVQKNIDTYDGWAMV